MKFNKTILAAALLSVAAVGCASKDHKADAPAPAVVNNTTLPSDDAGSVSDSDVMEDDSISSGTSMDSDTSVESGATESNSTGDEVWSDDVESGTSGEESTTDDVEEEDDSTVTPPAGSGSTIEPMDEPMDSDTGTTTSDGM